MMIVAMKIFQTLIFKRATMTWRFPSTIHTSCSWHSPTNDDKEVTTNISKENSKHGRINVFLIDKTLKKGLGIHILQQNMKHQSQNPIISGISGNGEGRTKCTMKQERFVASKIQISKLRQLASLPQPQSPLDHGKDLSLHDIIQHHHEGICGKIYDTDPFSYSMVNAALDPLRTLAKVEDDWHCRPSFQGSWRIEQGIVWRLAHS